MPPKAADKEVATITSPSIQTNLDLVVRAGTLMHTRFVDPDEELFADDFVFHYVNPRLAELDGDYHGDDGFRSFFEQLGAAATSQTKAFSGGCAVLKERTGHGT